MPLSPLASHLLLFGLLALVLGTAWVADRRMRRDFEQAMEEEVRSRLAAEDRTPSGDLTITSGV